MRLPLASTGALGTRMGDLGSMEGESVGGSIRRLMLASGCDWEFP
jgi:hypothetical protein